MRAMRCTILLVVLGTCLLAAPCAARLLKANVACPAEAVIVLTAAAMDTEQTAPVTDACDHYSKSDCAHACRCAVTAWGIYALSDPEMPELDDKQQVACAAYSLQVLQDKEVLSPGARAAFKGNCPYKACS